MVNADDNAALSTGYANYKVGYNFNSLHLTEDERNARLGTCIYYAERGETSKFNKMMLDELTSNKKQHTFIVDTKPNNLSNLLLRFSEAEPPIYRLDNYTFESKTIERLVAK